MNLRPLSDFEEYAVSTSADTSYMKLWSTIKTNVFYYRYAVSKSLYMPYWLAVEDYSRILAHAEDPQYIVFNLSNTALECLIVRAVWEFFVELLWIVVQDKMSQDVITVGSTMRIPLLYRVSLAGTAQNAPPTLKDPKFWTAEEKKTRKIDRLARSLLIQGLPNDIYSLIGSNETAKDLWDALERHMRDSEYGEQDRKAAILYEYETFKAIEGERLLDTYLQYLQVINDLKKCGQTKNLMDINIDALYNILKQNQGDVNDAFGYKKKAVMVHSDPLELVAEKTNITALLAKAFNRRKFYSKPTNNNLRTSSTSQSVNKKQEFVKMDDKKVEKKADEKKRDMSKVKCYNCKKEGHFAKDCKKAKEINANMVFMAQIEKVLSESDESSLSAEETIAEAERYEYMIRYSALFDNDKQHRKQIADQEVLFDKMSVQLVELDKHVRDLKNTILEKVFKNSELEECFENPRYLKKSKDLRPSLYDEKVIGLGYTPMFLTHFDEALESEKFKRSRENKIEFAYDYGNMNASYVNEKINFEDDYFQEIINPDFEKIDSSFQQTSPLKPYVSNVILKKIIIDLEDEVVNLLEKEKANLETIESLKSKGFESSETVISESENQSENDCHVVEKECDKVENTKVIAPGMFKLSVSHSVSPMSMSMSKTSCESNNVENLDTFSSVRRPKHSDVVWKKKKGSMMRDLLDDNNFFIFDDESVKISPVSKMHFRKKPCDSMIVHSKSKLNKSLPRTVHKWLPKLQPLAETVAKWFLRIVQIYLWIIDSGCSKHITGNRALLTNFVEKFLGTVCFGNNDFAVIAGYGDVVIGSMTIKKVYFVEGLGHKLFSVGQFCNKGLEEHHKSKTAFASNKPLFLLHMDLCGPMRVQKFKNKTLAKFFDEVGITQQLFAARMPQQNGVVERRNRTLVESARTMLTFINLPSFLWAEAIATMNKRKPNTKFFRVFGCRCYLLNDYKDVEKLKAKGDIGVFVGYSKESAAFRIYNKRIRADNRPPMLEKDMYDSWKSRMELYMLNRPHGRMILESVEQGPLIWPSVEVEGVTRLKKYSELSVAEAIQADCDVKATNIILQGLPLEVYALVSTHKVAKELWERIQMLMQGTSLTKQERECKLYDAFDKFAYQKGETLRDFYLRFSLLLNDMNMYNMKLEQFQVNTKFLNTLPAEWSKFVTDVKLVRDLHTTNVDQLHAYLGQHEYHANEVRLMTERNSDPLALISQHQLNR
nr:hypothetical protein [Tanacetum cinerariifolium]